MPEPILGPVPFRLRSALAAPPGWPPDVLPNQLIASAHINLIRDSVFAWPGDVDGQNHKLKNVILENVVGVVTDPTTTKGDLIARGASALVRLGVGADGQVLIADAASVAGLKWIPFPAVGVSSVFGRAGIVTAQAGDYNVSQVTNALSSAGSYPDPPWLTSIAWTKVAGAPATFPPAAHTHAATDIVSGIFSPSRMGSGVADQTVFLRGDGTWAAPGGPGGVVPTSRLVASGYGLTGGHSLATDVTLAVVDNTNIQKVRVLRAGAVIGARWSLNLIEGSNVTISAVDDAGNDRVNVTIASAGGGGTGGAVDSVFGRTGAVLAQNGDYNVSQITGALADPTTSKGDILARTVSALARVPVGIDGQVLTADNAQPTGVKWAAPAGGGAVASVFGRTGIVTAQPGDYTAAQVTGAVVNPTSAKGDLMVRDDSAVQRLPLGSTGFVLTADSAQPLGVKWAAAAAGGSQTPWTSNINAANFDLNSVGHIGIGIPSTTYPLEIRSTDVQLHMVTTASAGRAGAFFENDVGDWAAWYLYGSTHPTYPRQFVISSTRDMGFWAGGAERMRITTAGALQIGAPVLASTITIPSDGAADSGAFVVSTRNLGTLAERMRVSAAGLFGIGTASPLRILHLKSGAEPGFVIENASVAGGVFGHLWQCYIDSLGDWRLRAAPEGMASAFDAVAIQASTAAFTFRGGIGWDLGRLPNGFIGTSINEGSNTLDIWVKYPNGTAKKATLNLA